MAGPQSRQVNWKGGTRGLEVTLEQMTEAVAADYVASDEIRRIVVLTTDEYLDLPSPDPNTLYLEIEATD